MAKMKIRTAEPWRLPKSKGKGRNVNRSSDRRKSNIGGGDNPVRSKRNRNKSGSHLDPTINGAPNRSRGSGSGTRPDPLMNRNKNGDWKKPKINRAEPKKRSYK